MASITDGLGESPASLITEGMGLTPAQRWLCRAIEVLPPKIKEKMKRKYKWLLKPKHPDIIGLSY